MPLTRLRITLAHADPETRNALENALSREHNVIQRCATASAMIESALIDAPQFLVTGASFEDGDAIPALLEIAGERPVPSVMIAPRDGMPTFEEAMADHVMSCLGDPVDDVDLLSTVSLAFGRHQQLMGAEQHAQKLQATLEDRKLIERAKGVIMAIEHLNEADAFASLRRRAQNDRTRLSDVAERLLAENDGHDHVHIESMPQRTDARSRDRSTGSGTEMA